LGHFGVAKFLVHNKVWGKYSSLLLLISYLFWDQNCSKSMYFFINLFQKNLNFFRLIKGKILISDKFPKKLFRPTKFFGENNDQVYLSGEFRFKFDRFSYNYYLFGVFFGHVLAKNIKQKFTFLYNLSFLEKNWRNYQCP